MTEKDNELLRRYVREQSEPAFAELVQRHIRLVYSAALRQIGWDKAAAEDVAQAVFSDLARKAPALLRHSSLTGWLYTSTRFQAAKYRRAAQRRCLREHAAHVMNNTLSNDAQQHDWAALGPLLDDAMDELNRDDREMVLWRYFEGKPFAEIGLRLGLKENSARMRIERALDKLRTALAKRGITSTGVALAAALAAHAMEEVSSSLTERVFRASTSAGTAGSLAWLLVSAKARLTVAVGLLAVAGIMLALRFTGPGSPDRLAPAEFDASRQIPVERLTAGLSGNDSDSAPANSGFDPTKETEFRLSLMAMEDSRPIENGEVACTLETRSDSEMRKLRSDHNGMVQIKLANGTIGLRFVTAIEGFADTRLAWRQDRGEVIPREYTLKLAPGVTLGGSVVDANKNPLAGAEVVAYLEEPTTSPRPECHVVGFNLKTDEAGRWRICRVAPELVGNLTLSARHRDFALGAWLRVGVDPDAEQQLRDGSYTFHLGAATTVSGLVVDPEDFPVRGATVRVGGLYEVGTRTTQTGPDGSFILPGCELGTIILTAEAEGFAPTTLRVNSKTNFVPIRLGLTRGQTLSVRVLDLSGRPVPNASLDVEPNLSVRSNGEPQQPQTFRRDRHTDTNGVAFFSNLPSYDLWVGVSANGFIRQDGLATRAGGTELVVNLVSNLLVSGTVRDAVTLKPIPQFRIRAGKPDTQGPYFSDLDRFVLNFAGGEFRHAYDEGVTLGENPGYLLRFEADGYAPFVSRLIAPDEGSVVLEVNLRPASTRRLSVFNPDGTPAAWTDIGLLDLARDNSLGLTPGALEHHERTDGALQQTDAKGVVKLPSDGELHWVVVANRAGYLETNLDGIAADGSLQLQPWGRIEGAFSGAPKGGADQEEVWIQLVQPRLNALMAGSSFHVKPDGDGHFLLPRVPPGEIWVMVGVKSVVSPTMWTWNSRQTVRVEVRPGEITHVAFDGNGNASALR